MTPILGRRAGDARRAESLKDSVPGLPFASKPAFALRVHGVLDARSKRIELIEYRRNLLVAHLNLAAQLAAGNLRE